MSHYHCAYYKTTQYLHIFPKIYTTQRFDIWHAKHIYHLHRVYTNSGINKSSYPAIKGNSVVRPKAASAVL